ncbi:hypothetical protein O6072_20245 [Mycolicibacterium neoaurum]|uniref:hypothetical protein n=1 Tax=Mycolicibacterium neoaurum TaxID=1795 RepID=UPI00248BD2C9|nr:hypothetical protein [Mycolicibacterium neoaurum]WBP94037.1 hypothetical protein O7W24_23390 [Mycolicibacterium neoaurum]WBS07175.1 hypothetical protein O6072_20245 [Mycolicibacterium neoaurum]
MKGFPAVPLIPATPTSIIVREARDAELLTVVPRAARGPNAPRVSAKLANVITIDAAEVMRSNQYDPQELPAADGYYTDESAVINGDVLVWATDDLEVHAVVSPVTSRAVSNAITVLRCGPDLDPSYLALVLCASRNAIYTTGSSTPTLRVLDLLLPVISITEQRQIAD